MHPIRGLQWNPGPGGLKEGPCGWLEMGQGKESGRRETGERKKSRFSRTVKGRLGGPSSTRSHRGA